MAAPMRWAEEDAPAVALGLARGADISTRAFAIIGRREIGADSSRPDLAFSAGSGAMV